MTGMGKHKNKIIAVAVILAVLAGAWFFGGNYNKSESYSPSAQSAVSSSPPSEPGATGDFTIPPSESVIHGSIPETPEASGTKPPGTEAAALPTSQPSTNPTTESSPEFREQSSEAIASGEERLMSGQSATEGSATQSESGSDETQGNYNTDPVPEGKPEPVEPQDVTVGDGSFTVTLSVRCDMILSNMNLLNKEKHELVPSSGVIFPATVVTVYEGESVFNVLQREMRRAGIHMTFRNTPIYNSAYIEAINNLYEFDVGELSGWMYKVNGWYPNYGCSRYQLQPGDVIEWHYTCDLGRDLGEYWLGGGQLDE